MNAAKQNKFLKYILIGCAAVILILSVVLCVTAAKNKDLKNGGSVASEALVSAEREKESLDAVRASEAESYRNQLNEQSSVFADEKNALNQTIADLNKQLAVKRAAEAAANASKPTTPGTYPDWSNKTIYLTFDDGPSPRTPEVLKILRDNGVKATFFVTHLNGKSSHYMKDIVAEGHTIALHSYTHDYKKIYASEEAYFADLQQISDLVYSETGVRTNLMRFPGGASNIVSKFNPGVMSRLTHQVTDKGYVYFDWNLDSSDADKGGSSAQNIINTCRKNVPGGNSVIVLMHDSAEKRTTVEALPEVIAYYKAAGCNFAALSETSPKIQHGVAN
ncbi:MAG: polysaccharide deacetylase [Lachnospiraceae bacterium]